MNLLGCEFMGIYSQTNVIKQKELHFNGKSLLLSWIQWVSTGLYDVVVLQSDGEFLDSYEGLIDYSDAEFYFNKLKGKYNVEKCKKKEFAEKKIPNRYLKFAKDYNAIYQECKTFFMNNPISDDGSASNFDCCLVFIGKRVKKGFLNAALCPYGLKANIHKDDLISVYVPYIQYQGNGNTIQVKFMVENFNKLGYNACIYYQID